MKKEIPYKVFISHSTEDADFAEALVELLESIAIKGNSIIFCSSVPEYGIPPSEQIIDYLRKQFDENRLFVIFIHSKCYYKSHKSLNEMGAAWALKTDFYSFLVKGFNYDEMDGVIDRSFISTKVDAKEAKTHLNNLRDKLTDVFNLNKDELPRWEHYRDQFLDKVNSFSTEA